MLPNCSTQRPIIRLTRHDYGVSFLDFSGVIRAGNNLDEAREMATEALAFHLEGLSQDGGAAPEPSSLKDIMAIAENKDGVAVLIEAPAAEVKSVRINITMPVRGARHHNENIGRLPLVIIMAHVARSSRPRRRCPTPSRAPNRSGYRL
jgi:predicted RNase H-like HicB family nuclease